MFLNAPSFNIFRCEPMYKHLVEMFLNLIIFILNSKKFK